MILAATAVLICSILQIACSPGTPPSGGTAPGLQHSPANTQTSLEDIIHPGADLASIIHRFGEPVTSMSLPDGRSRLSFTFQDDLYPGIAGFVIVATNNQVEKWVPTYSVSGSVIEHQSLPETTETGVLLQSYRSNSTGQLEPLQELRLHSVRHIDVTNFYITPTGEVSYSNIVLVLHSPDFDDVAAFTERNNSNLLRVMADGIPVSEFIITGPLATPAWVIPYSPELLNAQ